MRYKFKLAVFEHIQTHASLPQRVPLQSFIRKWMADTGQEVHGRGNREFGYLVNRMPVTADFAMATVRFFRMTRSSDYVVPQRDYVQGRTDEEAFKLMFELAAAEDVPRQYPMPTQKNDPMSKGLIDFTSAASFVVSGMVSRTFFGGADKSLIDRPERYREYADGMYAQLGFTLNDERKTKKRAEPLSLVEAIQIGKEWVGDDGDFEVRDIERLVNINPLFGQRAFDPKGELIGMLGMHPITPLAYEDTLSGRLTRFDFDERHIPTRGNHIYIKSVIECHPAETGRGGTKGLALRRHLYSWLLFQMASLLDTDAPGPIRIVSPALSKVDVKRLGHLGFQPTSPFRTYSGNLCKVMVLDSDAASGRSLGMVQSFRIKWIHDALWNLRTQIDSCQQ